MRHALIQLESKKLDIFIVILAKIDMHLFAYLL